MISLEVVIAGVMLMSLVIYALGAGADFGGGVWDLFATGATGKKQRDVIAHAIGPIWEANHVWLILVIVVLFVAFPAAFSAISNALHIPLTLMLIGIVLRGSAFTFRSYDVQTDEVQRRWSTVFAVASIVTPITLGICVGAVASGRIRVDPQTGRMVGDFVSAWLAPFPFAIGGWTLSLFAFLAGVYLILETEDPQLREAFRTRALLAGLAVGAFALLSFLLSRRGAPLIYDGLSRDPSSVPFQCLTGLVSVGAFLALWKRAYRAARVLAIAQVTLILGGWGLAQFPFVLPPGLTFQEAAAPVSVLRLLTIALGAGAVLLFPSLWYLFRVFKR